MESIITLTGNAGTDVEFTPNEQYLGRATFRLGATSRVRRNGEWVDGGTTWLRVNCWRALAVHVAESVHKGDPLLVTGRMRTDEWVNADGVVKYVLTVEATSVGHDLNRGVGRFRRAFRPPEDEAPTMESPADEHEAELLRPLAEQAAAEREAEESARRPHLAEAAAG